MPSDLTRFDLAEMLRCGRAIRIASAMATSMEAAAQNMCESLFRELRIGTSDDPAAVMVRCYKINAFGTLTPELKAFARKTVGDVTPPDTMQCLVLLGSAGIEAEWNSRHHSRGHQAIGLPSAEIVLRAPMIAELFIQLGVPIEQVVTPSADVVRSLAGRTYGVFHVEHAVGSQYIPAQDGFVVPYGVRSVVGFGGALTNGDLFAVILFAAVSVSGETADRFRALALDVKSSLFRFDESEVFGASP